MAKTTRHNGNSIIQGMVILGDFVVLNIVLGLYILLFPNLIPPVMDVKTRIFVFFCNMAMVIAQYFYYSVIYKRHVTTRQIITRVFKLVLTQTLLAFTFIRLIYNNGGMFKFMLYYAPTVFFMLLLVRIFERYILSLYRKRGGNTRSVILVGSDPANIDVYETLVGDPSTGYKILGYYSNDTIANCPDGLKKLGSLNDLNTKLDSPHDTIKTDDLFCCLSHNDSDEIRKIIDTCDKNVIRFHYVPRMFGNYSMNLQPERIGRLNIFTNHPGPLTDPLNKLIKRSFDIIVSAIVCLILLPFLPIIALIIKSQSRGPVFFSQDRTGLDGKTFRCYKFRSMHVNDDADMQQATLDDPRKFPFGNFMRKCNIDEFPQFFNVLKGDMSIVGPRPHMLHHTEVYSKLIDKYMVRHFSKPGITGWAQVTGFRGETKELWQMEERIKRDIWYIENWSFWLDIRIIIMTATSIIRPDKKAY